jgi:hypothetical protein
MSTTVRTFDPSKVIVAIAGVGVISGFADGTFVKVTRSGSAFEKKRGAAGEIDRINKNAYDFEVEITLKQTSPYNAVLSGLLAADQLSNQGIFPLTITDTSASSVSATPPSVFAAPSAWIEKDPDVDYADSLKNYTWKIATGVGANFIAGD